MIGKSVAPIILAQAWYELKALKQLLTVDDVQNTVMMFDRTKRNGVV